MPIMPLAPGASKLRQEARAKANRAETLHQRLATARAPQYRIYSPESPKDHVPPQKQQEKQDKRLLSFKAKKYPAVERPELAPTRQRKNAREEQLRKKRESARQIDSKRPRQQERVIPLKRRNLGNPYLEGRTGRREA